jgi:2-aminoethylphosphonate-pyruvate transaminase
VLILENGAYGKRMSKICEAMSIPYHMESFPENDCVNLKTVEELLQKEKFALVACVHCETSSGVFNPVEAVGRLVKKYAPGKFQIMLSDNYFIVMNVNDYYLIYIYIYLFPCIVSVCCLIKLILEEKK